MARKSLPKSGRGDVDSSILIAYLRGEAVPHMDGAAREGSIVVAPLVVTELMTGAALISEGLRGVIAK